jgi:hypothetical protein
LATGFLATAFFAVVVFLAAGFAAAFLATGFFAAGFFAVVFVVAFFTGAAFFEVAFAAGFAAALFPAADAADFLTGALDDEAFGAAGFETDCATGLTTFRAGALVAFFATFFALVPIVGRAGAAARGGATPGRCTTVPSFFTVFGAWVANGDPSEVLPLTGSCFALASGRLVMWSSSSRVMVW